MDDVKIVKMEFPDEKGGISLTARSPAFAAECVKMFKEDGGVNYVEWRMSAGEPGFGIFTVCIQREAGETPAQQNGRLREELRQTNLQISELKAALLKIASAEHSVHDLLCEREGHGLAYCACDARLAADALVEKPKCECACPCHKEIERLGHGSPCGVDECAPCGRA